MKTLSEMQRYTTFIEIYTFLDSAFSTLIENRNDFQFSQAVCAKSSSKHTCLKPREISIRLISLEKSPVVTSFVSFLYVIPYPFFVCNLTVGRVDIGKFTVNKANVKRLCILIKKFRL